MSKQMNRYSKALREIANESDELHVTELAKVFKAADIIDEMESALRMLPDVFNAPIHERTEAMTEAVDAARAVLRKLEGKE